MSSLHVMYGVLPGAMLLLGYNLPHINSVSSSEVCRPIMSKDKAGGVKTQNGIGGLESIARSGKLLSEYTPSFAQSQDPRNPLSLGAPQ